MSQRIQTPFLVFGMKLRHLFLLLLCGTIQIPVSFQMIEAIGYVGFQPGAPEPIDVDYLWPEDRGSHLEAGGARLRKQLYPKFNGKIDYETSFGRARGSRAVWTTVIGV